MNATSIIIIGALVGSIYLGVGIWLLRKGVQKGGLKEHRRLMQEIRDKDVRVSLPGGGEIRMEGIKDLERRAADITAYSITGLMGILGGGTVLLAVIFATSQP